MPKYTARTPVKHDGKRYGVGDKLTLKADEAAPLLQLHAIEEAESVADKAAAEQPGTLPTQD
jgi:hypothetical protein